jgi:hypothetical protein
MTVTDTDIPVTAQAVLEDLRALTPAQQIEFDRRATRHWRRHGDGPFGRAVKALRESCIPAENSAVEEGCGMSAGAANPIIAQLVRDRISATDYDALMYVWQEYVRDGCPATGPRHLSPRDQTPPFMMWALTYIVLYGTTLAVLNLPEWVVPAVVATVGSGLHLWPFVAATWRAR